VLPLWYVSKMTMYSGAWLVNMLCINNCASTSTACIAFALLMKPSQTMSYTVMCDLMSRTVHATACRSLGKLVSTVLQ